MRGYYTIYDLDRLRIGLVGEGRTVTDDPLSVWLARFSEAELVTVWIVFAVLIVFVLLVIVGICYLSKCLCFRKNDVDEKDVESE